MRLCLAFFFVILQSTVAMAYAPLCEQPPATDALADVADAIVDTDAAMTAIMRNTDICPVVNSGNCNTLKAWNCGGTVRYLKALTANQMKICTAKKSKGVQLSKNECNANKINLRKMCRSKVEAEKLVKTIGDNIGDRTKKTGSAGMCFRGVKAILSQMYGENMILGTLDGTTPNGRINDMDKLSKLFKKVPFVDKNKKLLPKSKWPKEEDYSAAGTVCILKGGTTRYGHIEIKGADGNYYSDYNEGANALPDRAGSSYKRLACYVPTVAAKTLLTERISSGKIPPASLVLPANAIPVVDDGDLDAGMEDGEADPEGLEPSDILGDEQ